jgi:CO dehydrogenase maturation factor
MKIAVSGKGGVGKTFIAGTLAALFVRRGHRVIALVPIPRSSRRKEGGKQNL